jgi:Ca-activated chloride channel homolog
MPNDRENSGKRSFVTRMRPGRRRLIVGITAGLLVSFACARMHSTEGPHGRTEVVHSTTAPGSKPGPAGGSAAASASKGEEFGMIGMAAPAADAPKSKQVESRREALAGGRPHAAPPAPTVAARKMAMGSVGAGARPLVLENRQDHEFNTEGYKGVQENPFRLVSEAPLSTFSVDVDTASYSNMRRFVTEGRLPPPESIRVEEWVNYFAYDDPTPSGREPFAVATEVSECPWDAGHKLLRVALSTERISQDRVPPRNLVFLVDVSGSMMPANKLPLLKRGLAMLARNLRPADTLSIVVYAGASGLALPPTSGKEQSKILATLENLQAGGSTNGAQGIELAYQVAQSRFKQGGINRVILATDGDFNVGVTSEGALQKLIEEKRRSGVFLTVLGFGEGNVKDSTMEMLADKGNGNYAYVDSLAEARKVLVHEAGATLVTVAKDVKLQLEFNPRRVKSYRLVGYENRLLADQDFNDDTKDAGEMGAGHHVTAFYEIVPAGSAEAPEAPRVDPLKYQTARAPAAAASSNDLVTVKIRYKPPGGGSSLLVSETVRDEVVPLASASESLRFGIAVAEFGLALRGHKDVPVQALNHARRLAADATGPDPFGDRREFIALMDRAAQFAKR